MISVLLCRFQKHHFKLYFVRHVDLPWHGHLCPRASNSLDAGSRKQLLTQSLKPLLHQVCACVHVCVCVYEVMNHPHQQMRFPIFHPFASNKSKPFVKTKQIKKDFVLFIGK